MNAVSYYLDYSSTQIGSLLEDSLDWNGVVLLLTVNDGHVGLTQLWALHKLV